MCEHHHLPSVDVLNFRAETYRSVDSIERLAHPIPYTEFFRKYLLPNRACVLGSWATAGWRSRKDWVTAEGKPNSDYFLKHFGTAECCVANCGLEQYNTHPKSDMTVDSYVAYLKRYQQRGYPAEIECLYLKDWHFTKLFPDYDAYSVPMYFASDWMNEYWDSRVEDVDDYRFVYFGPKGSWTSFHSDVLRSYSWSANIVGCKKWIFFPPGEEEHLKDSLGNLVYNLDSLESEERKKFPNADNVRKRFEVLQHAGEVIFVPSGWHHQVYNMEDTISINHNWLNGCNIDLSWEHVKQTLEDVKREISDVRDMDGWGDQCQLLLKCSSGIDYRDFYEFMLNIAEKRLEFLSQLPRHNCCKHKSPIGYNQATNDTCQQDSGITDALSRLSCANGRTSTCCQSCHRESGGNGVSETPEDVDESQPISCRPEGGVPGITRDAVMLLKKSSVKPGIPRVHIYESAITDTPAEDVPHHEATESTISTGEYYRHLDINHVLFDVWRVRSIVQDMVKLQEFSDLDLGAVSISPEKLLSQIDEKLKACCSC